MENAHIETFVISESNAAQGGRRGERIGSWWGNRRKGTAGET